MIIACDLSCSPNKYIYVCVCMYVLGMRGIPVLEKYQYLLYFKRYDIIILLISVFHTLLFRSASQIAANPVNLTTEQRYGSNRLNSINAPEIYK